MCDAGRVVVPAGLYVELCLDKLWMACAMIQTRSIALSTSACSLRFDAKSNVLSETVREF